MSEGKPIDAELLNAMLNKVVEQIQNSPAMPQFMYLPKRELRRLAEGQENISEQVRAILADESIEEDYVVEVWR